MTITLHHDDQDHHDHRGEPATTLTLHERIGFELGWDYAHYRLQPPAPYAQEPSPLRDGWLAGQAAFGQRTLLPGRHVRKWLQLRLHAWLRGRSVELTQVTPNYLKQIDASHCPITRAPLSTATPGSTQGRSHVDPTPSGGGSGPLPPPGDARDTTEASIDRVRNDAGYAAGNLAVMSARANHAKGTRSYRDAVQVVRRIEAEGLAEVDGLNAAMWSRVAVLASFVEPLAHDEALALPLLVLPPNRLRLFNPVQALAALVCRMLLAPGWAQRASRLEVLLPGKPARRAFQMFFHALVPRVLEARSRAGAAASLLNGGSPLPPGPGSEPPATRWAVEDAWRNALVRKRWIAFARQLSAAQCERVVQRAAARGLAATRVEALTDARATEGWNLESRGYVPHAVLMRRGPAGGNRQVPLPI